MSKKISQLSLITKPTGEEVLPLALSGNNFSMKLKDIGTVITKDQIGLGNVDNTSDRDKPVSAATQTALNGKADLTHSHIIGQVAGLQAALNDKSDVGHRHSLSDVNNLVASLAAKADLTNGKVEMSQIPDDIHSKVTYKGLWDFNVNPLPAASSANKGWYYVASNNMPSMTTPSYVAGDWSVSNGSTWDKIDNSDGVQSVAGRTGAVTLTSTDIGDWTDKVTNPIALKANSESPTFSGTPKAPTQTEGDNSKALANTEFVSNAINKATGALTKYDVGLGNVDNTSDADKPISNATKTALDNKADKVHVHVIADVTGLQPALDGKAALVHNHAMGDITGLTAALADKANKVHTHVMADVTDLQPALDLKANKAGDIFTGQVEVPSLVEKAAAVPATNDINMKTATFWTKTVSGNTTFTVSNAPTSNIGGVIILTLTNGGSATVGWWSGIKWANGTVPALTAAGKDVLGFFTIDGGLTWSGVVLSKDAK